MINETSDIEEITDKIEGDFRIETDVILRGMVTGDVIVSKDCKLVLHGMIVKDLILEEGSLVELHGMVNQNVYNKGGTLKVYGMIRGILKDEGETYVDPNAKILQKKK